jgi:O-methyltransferase
MANEDALTEAQWCPEGPEELYLTLLKKCLTRYLFYEQWRPVQPHPSRKLVHAAASGLQRLLSTQNLVLMRAQSFDKNYALNGGPWNDRYSGAETMIGIHRLGQIQNCIIDVRRNRVCGDFIETGTWRGGASIFMRAVLKAYGDVSRHIWVADSFMGMPQPDLTLFPQDADSPFCHQSHMAVALEQVKQNFAKYDLLDAQVRFLAGWFRDTLPAAPIDHLAIIRLDSLMYESTTESLEYLYPKLSVGGYVIIDDYFTPYCTQAVDNYRRKYDIAEPLQIDGWPQLAVFWQRRG